MQNMKALEHKTKKFWPLQGCNRRKLWSLATHILWGLHYASLNMFIKLMIKNIFYPFHYWFLRKFCFILILHNAWISRITVHLNSGTLVWRNLNMHIIMILHSKYCIIFIAGSWEEIKKIKNILPNNPSPWNINFI